MSKNTSTTPPGLSPSVFVIPNSLKIFLQLRKISQPASNSNERREQNE
jgi:hypothetical protein